MIISLSHITGGKTCIHRTKFCSKLICKAVANASLEFGFTDTNLSFSPTLT